MLLYGEKSKIMDFSETIFVYDLKLATDDRSDKGCLLTSKLCPLGLNTPCPGAIYMHYIMKKTYKIRLQRDFFETCNKFKVIRPLCRLQNFVPLGLSAPAPRLYTCINSWKKLYRSDFKEIFLKLATNDRSDKMFLLTSKLCPQRVVSPCPGAIYLYNIMKKNV